MVKVVCLTSPQYSFKQHTKIHIGTGSIVLVKISCLDHEKVCCMVFQNLLSLMYAASQLDGLAIYFVWLDLVVVDEASKPVLYRRVQLKGVALYYIIYRLRNSNLCRAKSQGKSMERNGYRRVSSHCITISSEQYQKYKCRGCT